MLLWVKPGHMCGPIACISDVSSLIGATINFTSQQCRHGDWNWVQVVNGGMTAAALAFADAGSTAGLVEAAARTFENATAAIKLAFNSYAPVGAWPEGPGYWGYGTRYALTASTMLSSATGSDLGLSEATGFEETGKFGIKNLSHVLIERRPGGVRLSTVWKVYIRPEVDAHAVPSQPGLPRFHNHAFCQSSQHCRKVLHLPHGTSRVQPHGV
jgi:hypothetical protein